MNQMIVSGPTESGAGICSLPPSGEDRQPVGGYIRDLIDANPMVGERRAGGRRFWTGRELKVLAAHYPVGGVEACLPLLPGRSASSIYNMAGIKQLRRPNATGVVTERRHWVWSAQQDAAIRTVYAGRPERGAVKHLATTLGRPLYAVSQRALTLGLTLPRFKELPWSEAELDLLRSLGAAKDPRTLQRIFRKAGFARTATAIKIKCRRLHIDREADDGHYTGYGLAIALGVDRKRVSAWIERGLIKARRHRVSEGPLDDAPWRISRRHAREFIVDNVAIIDFARVDKFWLVDLLTGRAE